MYLWNPKAILPLALINLVLADNWIRNVAQGGTLPSVRDCFAETYIPEINSIVVAGGSNPGLTTVYNGKLYLAYYRCCC